MNRIMGAMQYSSECDPKIFADYCGWANFINNRASFGIPDAIRVNNGDYVPLSDGDWILDLSNGTLAIYKGAFLDEFRGEEKKEEKKKDPKEAAICEVKRCIMETNDALNNTINKLGALCKSQSDLIKCLITIDGKEKSHE